MTESMVPSFDDTKLFLKTETTPDDKAVIVIVHGLCEHQGRYDYFAEKLHAAGFGTYRFDHRGHGKSEGECAYYDDYNQILDDTNMVVDKAIAENPDKPVFLYGHSMGGYTVALYGVKYPDKALRGIICNGGLTADKGGFLNAIPGGLDPHQQLPNELGDGVCSVKEVTEWYLKDPDNRKTFAAGLAYSLKAGLDWYQGVKSTFAYPVFLTHGEKDALISFEDTYELFAMCASTDKQMKIYGGACHETINEFCKDEVIADYLSWMNFRI